MSFQNLQHKVSHGLSPNTFIESMTKNQEGFISWMNQFRYKNDEFQSFFQSFGNKSNWHCLIIAADWCGDVVRNVPVIFQLMSDAKIPTEVFVMEQHLDLIDEFLTFGGRSIPKVLFLNQTGDVVAEWGPRPAYVQEPMAQFKQTYTDKNSLEYEDNLKAARAEVVRRYGESTEYQELIVAEIKELLQA